MKKLWGSRFSSDTDQAVEAFTTSIHIDQRLAEADFHVSMAHAKMLGACLIIPMAESQLLVQGLSALLERWRGGALPVDFSEEDIHSQIEKWLYAEVGDVAGKLHTARSRNDLVVTSFRWYLKRDVSELIQQIRTLQSLLIKLAEQHAEHIMPGLTHTQHAQPVSLGHHLLAYGWMLQRDCERLISALQRVDEMPLGCGALAGTSFAIDRAFVAQELGFSRVSSNSLDAVGDRDFVIEILSALSLLMAHYSKFCEELIWWSTPEFGFVTLSDQVTTGSSMMPQKKNPDVAELIRGRVGTVYGQLMGALTMIKALPLSYNRDLQEDKEFLFNSLDTAQAATLMMHKQLSSARFHIERMAEALRGDFSNATDLADYLVTRGLAFREAHEVSGRVVKAALESGQCLEQMSLSDLRKHSPLFAADVLQVLKHDHVFRARRSFGGTAPEAVRAQLVLLQKAMQS